MNEPRHIKLYEQLRKAPSPSRVDTILADASGWDLHRLVELGQDHLSDDTWERVLQERAIRRMIYTSVSDGRGGIRNCTDTAALVLAKERELRYDNRAGILKAIDVRLRKLARTHTASPPVQTDTEPTR